MSPVIHLVIAVGVLDLLYLALRRPVRAFLKFRGDMVVACPENSRPAGVRVDARHAAVTAVTGQPGAATQHVFAMARAPRLWPAMPEADRSGPRRLPDPQHPHSLVRGKILRLLRQAPGRDQVGGAAPGADESGGQDGRVARPAPGNHPRRAGDAQARLLDLPHHRGLPPRTSRARNGARFQTRCRPEVSQQKELEQLETGQASC